MKKWERFSEEEIKTIYLNCQNLEEFFHALGYKGKGSGHTVDEIKKRYSWFNSYHRYKDETGKQYGQLIVIKKYDDINDEKGAKWECKCSCGNYVIVSGSNLRIGNTTSCGCYNKQRTTETNLIDLTGQNFGKWTVIKKSLRKTKNNGSMWICQCSCKNNTIKEISSEVLRRGGSLSCGCWHRSLGETIIENVLIKNNIKFKQEFPIKDIQSVNKGILRCDFAIIDDNDEVKYIIEFNGKQHYEPVEFFGGQEGFEVLKENDRIKMEYFRKNNIPLIIFFYKELKQMNEEYILNKIYFSDE